MNQSVKKSNSFYDSIDQIVTHGVEKGILHLFNEDAGFTGNLIQLKGKSVVNFGSCSYLGLEFDDRLKQGAKDAIDRYGTQFSESRAYVSLKIYEDLEAAFREIFGQPCVVTPTTSLGHISNLPVLVGDRDAVILDHQVHNSVQTAASLLKARGIAVELVRHNRMDLLEAKLKECRGKYEKVWYMADGIYSMYGDACPLDEVYDLLNRYEELYLYVDDAHGMSLYGKHGRGYVLHHKEMHPKMVMATSLAKAFATGGAVMVYPNQEMARRVRTCGGPLITSGPLQPATLGAALACAELHLTSEIYELQTELQDRIRYATMLLKKHGLPLVSEPNASVFFVGTSLPKLGYNMVSRMLDAGYYLNLGIFPAVPMKNTGIRFTITRLHSFRQIEAMIETMAAEFPRALREEGMTMEQVFRAFKMPVPEEALAAKAASSLLTRTLSLKTIHVKTIQDVDQAEWNQLFEGKGAFDWQALQTLEQSFSGNPLPEDNWLFDYVLVKDPQNKTVAATFFTTAIWKEDMLSPAAVSAQVEEIRNHNNPYYLTSKVVATGSLLSEGEHVYLDRSAGMWKEALQLLCEKASQLQEQYQAGGIVFRDFSGVQQELDNLMVDNGFFRIAMPDNHVVDHLHLWSTSEALYAQLSKRSQQHFREDVRKHERRFEVRAITEPVSEEVMRQYYEMYLQVKGHSLDLNTFTLPEKLFHQLLQNKSWEALELRMKSEDGEATTKPVAVVFCYKSGTAYVPMVIGIDYAFNKAFKVYRQALYQLLLRGRQLGMKRVLLGFSATVEKKKWGARAISTYAYMQSKDHFNAAVLGAFSTNVPNVVKQV